MKKLIFSILFVVSALCVYSQREVSIYVTDENGRPFAGAIATVLNVANNALLHSVVTDTSGWAKVKQVDFSTAMIKILGFGYTDYDIQAAPSDTLRISLTPLSVELGEVTATASSMVTQKSDRVIFNIANENLTKGNNSYELLKFTPLIKTDHTNRISIIGKEGIILYINGRKTNLSENSIQSYLQALPAEKIASIEIITDPGAAMRPSENQGIINIIIKKNENEGLKGNLNLVDFQRKKNAQQGNLFLDYQKNKFNLSTTLSYESAYIGEQQNANYEYILSNLKQSASRYNNFYLKNMDATIRGDYQLSAKQSIGFMLNGNYFNDGIKRKEDISYLKLSSAVIDSIIRSKNTDETPRKNVSANLNYRLATSEAGNQLSLDADYVRSDRERSSENIFSKIENGIEQAYYDRFKESSHDLFESYSGKIEYKHVYNQQNNLTVGSDMHHSENSSDFEHFFFKKESYITDHQKRNNYLYNEDFISVYLSYVRVWNQRFNSRVEARMEYAGNNGFQKITNEEIKREYVDVLPSLSLQYVVNSNHIFSYNFNTSMGRPGFYALNPFRLYISPNVYKEYNPNLIPSKRFNSTLNYIIKQRYIINFSYGFVQDCTNNFLVPAEGYTKLINANYGDHTSMDLAFIWNESFWKNRISLNAAAQGTYSKDKGKVESIIIDVSNLSYSLSLAANVSLSQQYHWNMSTSFAYRSKSEFAHEKNSDFYVWEIGFRKNFPQNNITVNFGVQPLLYKHNAVTYKNSPDYRYSIVSNPDIRAFYVGISIPFGNQKVRGINKSSSYNVKGRLKE
jgi:hypothetical protein